MRLDGLRATTKKASKHNLKACVTRPEKKDRKHTAQLPAFTTARPCRATCPISFPVTTLATSPRFPKPGRNGGGQSASSMTPTSPSRQSSAEVQGHLRLGVSLVGGAKRQIDVIAADARR